MIVAQHVDFELRDVNHIVERIHSSKIITFLTCGGLCLACDDFFPCWCYLGCLRSKFSLEGVEEFIHILIRHYVQHLVKKKVKYKKNLNKKQIKTRKEKKFFA